MREKAQAGAIELVYLDESGLAQVHPNRSAWTPCGEQHCIEAPRGQRLNVMAALFSSGKAVHARYWCSSTAEVFLGFVSDLATNASKPVVIVLDNASIHRAAAFRLALKRRSKEELEQAVDHVFANFGGQFKIEF
ncbi:MAG: transposase [Hydrogenophaga sp.]|nr:transposase [Hydrogenophaga sp.]